MPMRTTFPVAVVSTTKGNEGNPVSRNTDGPNGFDGMTEPPDSVMPVMTPEPLPLLVMTSVASAVVFVGVAGNEIDPPLVRGLLFEFESTYEKLKSPLDVEPSNVAWTEWSGKSIRTVPENVPCCRGVNRMLKRKSVVPTFAGRS